MKTTLLSSGAVIGLALGMSVPCARSGGAGEDPRANETDGGICRVGDCGRDEHSSSARDGADILVTAQRRAERVRMFPLFPLSAANSCKGWEWSQSKMSRRVPASAGGFGSVPAIVHPRYRHSLVRPRLKLRWRLRRQGYLNRASRFLQFFEGRQRIEVLRGPQRRFTAAIRSAGPSTSSAGPDQHLRGEVEAGIANYITSYSAPLALRSQRR